jgi:hypothetical protein
MKLTKNFIALIILFLLVNSSVISFKHAVSVHHKRGHARVKHHTHKHHSARKTSRNHSNSHFNSLQLPEDEVKKCDEEVDKSKIDVAALFASFALKITTTSFFSDVLSFVRDDVMKLDKLENVCIDTLVDLFDKNLEANKKEMREIYNKNGNGLSEKVDQLNYISQTEKDELKKIKSPKTLCKKLNEIYDKEKKKLYWKKDYEKILELYENAKKTGMTFDQMKKNWKENFFSDFSVEGRAKYKALTIFSNRFERNKTIANEKERFDTTMAESVKFTTDHVEHLNHTESKKDSDLAQIEYCDKLPDEFNPCADLTSGRITKSIVQTIFSLKGTACTSIIVALEAVALPKITELILPAMEKFLKTILSSWLLPVKVFWYLIRVTICGWKALKTTDKFVRSWLLGAGAAYLVKLIVTTLTAGAVYKKKKLRRFIK